MSEINLPDLSELLWPTLTAIGLMLILLIPGNYLISLFWHRNP